MRSACRWNFSYFILILSTLFIVGCSAKKTVYLKGLPEQTQRYEVVELPDFSLGDENWVPLDSASIIPTMVAEKLMVKGSFAEVRRPKSSGEALGDGTLLLKGTVLNYDAGCKFCEWFLGFNDHGKSSIVVRVEFVDSGSGDVIADVEILGKAKKPGTGRSRYARIVDEIVSIIEKVNSSG